jgi:demethylmenaquinone methyltransferase/2-methoxy-6-polyprenyl-1,4-benzoquinol methylase
VNNTIPINSTKEQQVEEMFNGIAHRYDFLNRVLSFGIDRRWRKKLVKGILKGNPNHVLDIATGTADLAIVLAEKNRNVKVTGVDIAENMLSFGRTKVQKKRLANRIELIKASALSLPFNDKSFDAAMVAFGVRNFQEPVTGLTEINRVLRPGAQIFVLEFTNPRSKFFGKLYTFYFLKVLPTIGRLVSGHSEAYTYLPASVKAFAEREAFTKMLNDSGFTNASYRELSFGIASLYQAVKPLS